MPYAHGAKIEHEFDTDHLNIWLTFRHPMDQNLKPPLALWLLEEDDNAVDIVASAWQDQFTILLTSDTVVDAPERVLLEYNGPNSNLQTTWGKDWEPWGPRLSTDIGKAPCFVDRGDPAAADYAMGDLTQDGAWHELDLSAIVPENAKAILFSALFTWGGIGKHFKLRKHGNANDKVISQVSTVVMNLTHPADMTVACDSDRKIDYWISPGMPGTISLTIKAWWF